MEIRPIEAIGKKLHKKERRFHRFESSESSFSYSMELFRVPVSLPVISLFLRCIRFLR